ncbi:hypothetical protein [Salinirubellus salinus]
MERAEEAARYGADPEWADCPECGGITSGEGIVCADCRKSGSEGP